MNEDKEFAAFLVFLVVLFIASLTYKALVTL